MAQKKVTIYILNVNESMAEHPDDAFQKTVDTVSCSLEDRAHIGRKTDLVSVLLVGTPDTDNILAAETPGQYQHVTALTPLAMTNVDLLKTLANLTVQKPEKPGDVLDALIVACQMIKLFCRHLKYTKQISIFTDARNPIDWEDIDFVSGQLKENNIELTVIGVDYADSISPDCPETVKTNYDHWKELIDSTRPEKSVDENATEGQDEIMDQIVTLDEAYEQTQTIFTKEVRPTPNYRGYLYFGRPEPEKEFLPISINMYLRSKKVSLPSGSKVSAVSQRSNGGPQKVDRITTYSVDVSNEETPEVTDMQVEKESLKKGFRFGKSILIISEEEIAAEMLQTKKGMSIIGFVDAKTFPRHYLFSNANIVTGGAYRPNESATAVATLAQALIAKGSYALVRFIKQDNAAPKIGILQAALEDDATVLHYFDVPWADDIRDYKFQNAPKPIPNNEAGYQLMEDLIDIMSLEELGEDYLAPEENHNPIAHRLKKAIAMRALNENSIIPDFDERFERLFKPPKESLAKLNGIDEEIVSFYKIKKVQNKGKQKSFGDEQFGTSQGDETTPLHNILGTLDTEASANISSGSGYQPKQTIAVSTATPVEDYKKLLAQEGDEDNVELANSQMQTIIKSLLEKSWRDQQYPKICACLEAMRETCAQEDEASTYNAFMRELKALIDTTNTETTKYKLWTMMKEKNLGLITNKECLDTDTRDVTEEVAQKFWKDVEEDVVMTNVSKDDDDNDKFDAEDLEDMF